jgi:hypothetical protein
VKVSESSKGKLHRKEKRELKHEEYSSDGERKGARKQKQKEIETAVPWTEEMVKCLFETYNDVHRRLNIESRGKMKNQKKWDPIIKTMQERFSHCRDRQAKPSHTPQHRSIYDRSKCRRFF